MPRSLLHIPFITIVFHFSNLFRDAVLNNLIVTKNSQSSNLYPERDVSLLAYLVSSERCYYVRFKI